MWSVCADEVKRTRKTPSTLASRFPANKRKCWQLLINSCIGLRLPWHQTFPTVVSTGELRASTSRTKRAKKPTLIRCQVLSPSSHRRSRGFSNPANSSNCSHGWVSSRIGSITSIVRPYKSDPPALSGRSIAKLQNPGSPGHSGRPAKESRISTR